MKVIDFRDRSVKRIEVDFKAPEGARTSCYRGADFYLMNSVTKAVANNDPGIIYSGILSRSGRISWFLRRKDRGIIIQLKCAILNAVRHSRANIPLYSGLRLLWPPWDWS